MLLLLADAFCRHHKRIWTFLPLSFVVVLSAWATAWMVLWASYMGSAPSAAAACGVVVAVRAEVIVLTGEVAASAVGKGASAGRWSWSASLGGAVAGLGASKGQASLSGIGAALAMLATLQSTSIARGTRGTAAWATAAAATAVLCGGTASAVAAMVEVAAVAKTGQLWWIPGGLVVGLIGSNVPTFSCRKLLECGAPLLIIVYLWWCQCGCFAFIFAGIGLCATKHAAIMTAKAHMTKLI